MRECRLPHRAEAEDVAAQAAGHRQHRGDHRAARARQLAPTVDPRRVDPQRLFDGGHPALAHPHARHGAGVGGQAVDVAQLEAGVGDGGEARVDGQRQRVAHEAAPDLRASDPPRAPTCARSARRRPARAASAAQAHRRGRRSWWRRSARTAGATRRRPARSARRPPGRCAPRRGRSRRRWSSAGRSDLPRGRRWPPRRAGRTPGLPHVRVDGEADHRRSSRHRRGPQG